MSQSKDDDAYDPKMEQILEQIRHSGQASVAELSGRLQTSESTIRRNLARLAARKLIRRFHGGATLNAAVSEEPPVRRRLQMQRAEKAAIAAKAAALVEDGDTIVMRAGTTVAAMIPHLLERKNLKIITNSLEQFHAFARTSSRIILTGGEIDFDELCTKGYLTSSSMKTMRAEKLFTGVLALHPMYGMMADDFDELEVVRSFVEAAEEVIVLADHTKFGVVAPVILASPSEIDVIITDSAVSPAWIPEFEKQGTEVITAGPPFVPGPSSS